MLLFYGTYVNFKNCPLAKLVEKWKGNHHMCNGMCECMHWKGHLKGHAKCSIYEKNQAIAAHPLDRILCSF